MDTYTCTQFRTTGNTAHTFQLTVAHTLGFSIFTSPILATDLWQSHCNFKSHVKSSWHHVIPFLPFLQLPILRILSTTVVYFTVLHRLLLLLLPSCQTLLITTLHGPHGKQPVLLMKPVYHAVA
jgi:hypothetical protein